MAGQRLHVIALPHVRIGSPTAHLCAYTGAKLQNFIRMMKDRHELVVYAPERDPIEGVTMVDCLSENARIAIFGKDDPNKLPAWPTDQQSQIFNLSAAAKIMERAEPHELVLLTGGRTHLPIKNLIPNMLCCEPGVGYFGVIGGNCHAAYESYFHMAQVAAKENFDDIRWYDRVIPPYCDPDQFPKLNDGKGDYLLFIGRLISRKGLSLASEIAKACKMRLVVAGAGGRVELSGDQWFVVGQDAKAELQFSADYRGPVGIEERAELMAGARAVICPTLYAEPGGNIAIEAQMSGTPVIAPDWGVFSETVEEGVSGFHFRTLRQAVEAVDRLDELDPEMIQARARRLYSLDAIGIRFDRWFADLQTLWGKGFYAQ